MNLYWVDNAIYKLYDEFVDPETGELTDPEAFAARYAELSISREEIIENFPQRFAEAYLLEMVDFIDCIQKDRKPELTVYDGTKATIVTYAITDSFHSGKAVKVEY